MSSSRGAHRFRASLATAQVGMATTLVALAGLFITSLVNVAGVDLGFEADGIATFQLDPYQNGYTPERAMTLFDRIGDELRHMPGVVDASVTTVPLFGENRQRPNVLVEGFAAGPDMDVRANFGQIGDGYFRTLGIPVVAGREFSRADRGARPTVAIVNEAFARKFRLEGPIGKHVALAGAGSSRPDVEIVGLVADAKYTDLREPPPPQLYFPYRQGPFGPLTFYVKSALEPPSRDAVATLVARIDPHLPIERFRSMDEQIWNRVTRDRVLAILSSWFAALATGLAALGLYALLAFAVAQRVKEIGIRVALGARSIDVCRLVFSEIAKIAAVGAGIGIAVALIFARLGAALLFGVGGSDPTIVIGTAGAVAVVVILAAAIPTRRALRVAPVVALRAD